MLEKEYKLVLNPKNEKMDSFIFDQKTANIFQTSYIKEVYKKTKRCEPLSLAVENENGEIVASLVSNRFMEISTYLKSFTSHSTIRGGPIFTNNEVGYESVSLLFKHYDKIEKKKSLYIRIYPFYDVQEFKSAIERYNYAHEDWLNYYIDLTKPKELLFSDLKRDKRRAINKAKENGVKIVEGEDKEQVHIFYDLLKQTHASAGLPLHDITLFESIFEVLVLNNMAKFFLAKYKGDYIAGRLILTYKNQIYDWYACDSKRHLKFHPNECLVWHILNWGSDNGYHTFDFGGAGKPDEKYGVRDFKGRFGGQILNYGRYTKIHSPQKMYLVEKVHTAFKKYRTS